MNEIKFITEKGLKQITNETNAKRHLAIIEGKDIPD